MTNKTYDFMKYVVQVALPAFATLYFTLAQIWGLPGAEKVIGTTAAVATFLGITLRISTKKYEASGSAYDGDVIITGEGGDRLTYSLELNDEPLNLQKQKAISFRVVDKKTSE